MYLCIPDPRTNEKLYAEFDLFASAEWKGKGPTVGDIEITIKSVHTEEGFINIVMNALQSVSSDVWASMLNDDECVVDALYNTFHVFDGMGGLEELAGGVRARMSFSGVA